MTDLFLFSVLIITQRSDHVRWIRLFINMEKRTGKKHWRLYFRAKQNIARRSAHWWPWKRDENESRISSRDRSMFVYTRTRSDQGDHNDNRQATRMSLAVFTRAAWSPLTSHWVFGCWRNNPTSNRLLNRKSHFVTCACQSYIRWILPVSSCVIRSVSFLTMVDFSHVFIFRRKISWPKRKRSKVNNKAGKEKRKKNRLVYIYMDMKWCKDIARNERWRVFLLLIEGRGVLHCLVPCEHIGCLSLLMGTVLHCNVGDQSTNEKKEPSE